jgi:FlaG/FlaF family flagellin (archaellin)
MKGISPIISIIIILFIVVAMAGVASTYIFGYWSGMTSGVIEIRSNYCTQHQTAHIIVKNIGTTRITAADFVVESNDEHTIVNATWSTTDYVDEGETVTWSETGCQNMKCRYIIIGPDQRTYETFVDCR